MLKTFLRREYYSVQTAATQPSVVRSSIEEGVKVARECCCDCVKLVKDKKAPIDDFIATGIGHSQCNFTFVFSRIFIHIIAKMGGNNFGWFYAIPFRKKKIRGFQVKNTLT